MTERDSEPRVTDSAPPPQNAIPESSEVRDEQFWRDGGGFRWCWPHFDIVKPADTRPRMLLNRYPHNVIGAMVVLFGRGWGVRWKESWSSSRARARALRRGGTAAETVASRKWSARERRNARVSVPTPPPDPTRKWIEDADGDMVWNDDYDALVAARNERDEARAECVRLREALRRIAKRERGQASTSLTDAQRIARAALALPDEANDAKSESEPA